VQGAEVIAKNKGTDLTRTISTSDAGYYRIELLPVGVYAITITRPDSLLPPAPSK